MAQDKRLRLKEPCRDILGEMKDGDETYSDVICRILPEADDDTILYKAPRTSLPVDERAYDKAMALADDGVPVREVIEHAILVQAHHTAGEEIPFDRVYNRGPQAETTEDTRESDA